jgi:ABC-type dipeptide/oligopeptide/nickel transport system permease component
MVLVAISLVTFLLLEQAPGDAAEALVGESASAAQLAAARHQMGLDVPLLRRYADFIAGIVQGDLGRSLVSGRPVTTLVAERFGATLELALATMVLSLVAGSAIGLLAAAHQGGYLDLLLMSIATLGISLPTFWVALLLILTFSLRLGWLPVAGAGSPAHLVLPAVSLALPTISVVARLMRAGMLDVKGAEYVRTAHSKGLSPRHVWQVHMLRNGLNPVITMLGLHLGHLLGGTFIVETIFGWPGLGRLVVQSVFDRDYPVLIGAVLLIAVMYQILNLAVDLIHAILDPRLGKEAL